MTLPGALALALALAGAPDPIRVVRIQAAEPERLARYVELRAGEPLKTEAVRHAVELLYATGEFTDVTVEVERGEEGLEVVFRPSPAPRLIDIRVEGDAVLGPHALRQLTRLLPREPLWPARLERARGEATAALKARGYLGAEVSIVAEWAPDPFAGADAVFRVRAGPRARVSSAVITPASAPEVRLLQHLVRPRAGDVYRPPKAQRAREAMVRRLVASGRWRARVEIFDTYDPTTAQIALTFVVEAGPYVTVEFRGVDPPSGLRAAVVNLLRDGAVRPDVLEEANDRIEEEFRRRGHRDVSVRHREEPRVTGMAVVYDVEPGPRAIVAAVRVVGDEGELGSVSLATRPEFPLEEHKLDDDVRTLTHLLEDRGYAQARAEVEVPRGGGLVPVVFRVQKGPRTVVREVTVEAPVRPTPGEQAPRELRVRAGAPYRLRDVAADRNALLGAYRNAGYLGVEVVPETEFSEDRSEARVRFRVVPGPLTLVDHVVVAGLDRTREVVVRRELLLKEGGPLGLQALLESQRRLATLGLFDRVSVTELDLEAERRSLVVAVAEGSRTTFAYGIGGSKRDFARGSFEFTRRNLFGLDRTLSAFVRASFRASRVLASFREPYLLGRRQELFAAAFREEEDRDSFNFIRFGGFLQTAHAFTPRLSLISRYAFQDTHVFDIAVPEDQIDREFQTYTASGPSFSVVNDTRDNPLDPRRGRFVGTDFELSLPALGGDPFVKGYLQAAGYQLLTSRVVLAVSGRLGLSRTFGRGPVPPRPAPESDPRLQLPLPERFFAGGAYSLRGFETDKAGPLVIGSEGEPVPLGGNAVLLAGAELRVNATRFIQLAAFSDIGNVYPLVSDLTLDELRYTAGVGLRYKTSLGPLRVDWGYKLNRRADEKPWRFHFAIGHAF